MELKKFLNGSGWLDVGGGHIIYWEDWGNPKAETPVFYLHGGPGSGIKEHYKLPFDASRQRVIFHDQRGAGRSTPFASTKNNTTQDLIGDINKLRSHLKISKISLFGGSWGSTLALCYAIANPNTVEKMLLRGIYLGTKNHTDYIYYGVGSHFPDANARFMSLVPKSRRSDVVKYYDEQFSNPDVDIRQQHVKEWVLYENALMNLDANLDKLALDAEEYDESALAVAKLETHYFLNNCFLPDNHILQSARKIMHIPTVIIHGRYDFVCAPSGAFDLKQALGPKAILQVVEGGHSASEPTMREVILAYARAFL